MKSILSSFAYDLLESRVKTGHILHLSYYSQNLFKNYATGLWKIIRELWDLSSYRWYHHGKSGQFIGIWFHIIINISVDLTRRGWTKSSPWEMCVNVQKNATTAEWIIIAGKKLKLFNHFFFERTLCLLKSSQLGVYVKNWNMG